MQNSLKIIKKVIILSLVSMAFTSCENENIDSNYQDPSMLNAEDVNFKNEVHNIAREYNYEIKSLDESEIIFKVSDTKVLRTLIERINRNFDTPQVKSLDALPIVKNTILNKNRSLRTNKSSEAGDPPYEYSITVFFDNTFPCANVYLTIDYNLDHDGNITSSNITTGSYGYSFGNTYSQTGANISYQNGSIIFQITGQFTTSIGISSFSLSNSNNVTYTGFLPNSEGGEGGYVRQQSTVLSVAEGQ